MAKKFKGEIKLDIRDSKADWLSADEKRLFSRMAEVYAAFSEYTDVQIGRLIDPSSARHCGTSAVRSVGSVLTPVDP